MPQLSDSFGFAFVFLRDLACGDGKLLDRRLENEKELCDKSILVGQLCVLGNLFGSDGLTVDKAYLDGISALGSLYLLIKQLGSDNDILLGESESGGSFKMSVQAFDSRLLGSSLKQGVLYYKVIDSRLTKTFSEHGIVGNVYSLVVHKYSAGGAFELVRKLADKLLL